MRDGERDRAKESVCERRVGKVHHQHHHHRCRQNIYQAFAAYVLCTRIHARTHTHGSSIYKIVYKSTK